MARVYALLNDTGTLLYAERKGKGWRYSERCPDCGPRGRNLAVFVDGRDVLGLRVTLPARNEREARRAAPFAIEDELGQAIEDVHVALRSDATETARDIDVVSVQVMRAWVERLDELGCPEASLISTHSLFAPGAWLFETSAGFIGQVAGRRFALDADTSADVIISQVGDAEALTVAGARLAHWFPQAEQVSDLSQEEAFLGWLAQQAEASEALPNLRQGAFQSRRPVDLSGLQSWQFAAVLLGLLGVGWFASLVLETYGLKQRISNLQSVRAEFVEAGWPEAQNNAERALALARSERRLGVAGFPPALTTISILYESLAEVSGSELRSLRYDQDRAQLSAVVAFDSFADADQLEQAIESRGLPAQANDARQSDGKIIGDVIIGGGDV